MATAEARSKKSLKKQDEIISRLTRIEDMLTEVLTGPGGAPPAAKQEAPPAFESASTLDLPATNRSIDGGNPPSPKPKAR